MFDSVTHLDCRNANYWLHCEPYFTFPSSTHIHAKGKMKETFSPVCSVDHRNQMR